ncbi:hypothetical protein NWF32_29745 [Pseudomonas qingdaonensis]|nr:hypothetical protein [Pseudomonas qingdaonensis]
MQDFKIQRPDPDGRAKPQSKPQSQPQQPDSTDHTAYYKPRHRQAQQNQSTYTRSSDNGPMLVYVLYLISLLVVVTAPAGLVYAYQSRAGANDLDRSHYTFQIRMFWIGLLLLGWASSAYPSCSAGSCWSAGLSGCCTQSPPACGAGARPAGQLRPGCLRRKSYVKYNELPSTLTIDINPYKPRHWVVFLETT